MGSWSPVESRSGLVQADLGMDVLGTTRISEEEISDLAKGCNILGKNKFKLCSKEVYKGQIFKNRRRF